MLVVVILPASVLNVCLVRVLTGLAFCGTARLCIMVFMAPVSNSTRSILREVQHPMFSAARMEVGVLYTLLGVGMLTSTMWWSKIKLSIAFPTDDMSEWSLRSLDTLRSSVSE